MKPFSLLAAVAAAALPTITTAKYTNPVLWTDLADLDILRVDDTFYCSSSTMHYSPGAPVLRSYDLVNWEFVGHSVPELDFAPQDLYNLDGGHAYVKGIWASFLNYRPSNALFYWGGCIDSGSTYIYTSPAAEGPWEQSTVIDKCYYDGGMVVDDDDDNTMYVAYGSYTIHVAQLSADGLSEVQTQEVFTGPDEMYIEGARFYKINGAYYILVTRPADAEYVLKSTEGPFGPYEMQPLVDAASPPVSGAGNPHQGGIVDTPNGDWYYMAFIDAYPGGRVPVLAPISWGSDGWPTLQLVDGGWGQSYPSPDVPAPPGQVKSPTGIDNFTSSSLGPEWEWNHNPDNSKWSLSDDGQGGMTLHTATVTDDLYAARNTLTHRILGPTSTGTIVLDISAMQDWDVAGFALLRDSSAWIGVKREGTTARVVMVNGLTMDDNWDTASTGSEVEDADITGIDEIHLRIAADIAPASDHKGSFSYSTDGGQNFAELGEEFTMITEWQFFMGYRFGIFNYATNATGGSVAVASFELSTP